MGKKSKYFDSLRLDIINLIPRKINTLLSIGSGSGQTEKYLKKYFKIKKIVAIDKEKDVATELRRNVDVAIIKDIEKEPLVFTDEYFDCILALDILEHLIEPKYVLMECNRLLKEKGSLIISIPNSQHFEVILRLLIGNFYPKPQGIMDSKHLHFFTKKTITMLLLKCGFKIDKIQCNYQAVLYSSDKIIIRKLQNILILVNKFINIFYWIDFFKIGRQYWASQYLIAAKKSRYMMEKN
jgi:O-antigen biosynthesis protein